MAITNYTELKEQIAIWLRPGATLIATTSDQIPEFIAMFEAEINGTVTWVGLETEIDLTATPASNTLITPDDYESPVKLWNTIDDPRTELPFIPPGEIPSTTVSGRPNCWTIKGGDIAFDKPCDSAYTFSFRYRQHLQLDDDNPTNTVLTNYPSLYLYGSLVQSALFVRDDVAEEKWKTKYKEAEGRMQAAENLSKGIALLRMDDGLVSVGRTRVSNITLG